MIEDEEKRPGPQLARGLSISKGIEEHSSPSGPQLARERSIPKSIETDSSPSGTSASAPGPQPDRGAPSQAQSSAGASQPRFLPELLEGQESAILGYCKSRGIPLGIPHKGAGGAGAQSSQGQEDVEHLKNFILFANENNMDLGPGQPGQERAILGYCYSALGPESDPRDFGDSIDPFKAAAGPGAQPSQGQELINFLQSFIRFANEKNMDLRPGQSRHSSGGTPVIPPLSFAQSPPGDSHEHQSPLSSAACEDGGLRSLTLLLAVRANTRRQVKNVNGGPRAAKDHVFKDRKMGDALLAVCPNLEDAQGLHYLDDIHRRQFGDYTASLWSAQDQFRASPSVYCVKGRPLATQFQYLDHRQQLLSILILSDEFHYQTHSLAPPEPELHRTTFPRARTWLLAVDEDMKENFKEEMIQKIRELCKTEIDLEEVGKVEVLQCGELIHPRGDYFNYFSHFRYF